MPYNYLHMHLAVQNALNKIRSSIYEKVEELAMTAYVTDEPVTFENRLAGRLITPEKGKAWGGVWDCAWFHFKGAVPESLAGKSVVLLIDLNGEACIVDEAGNPVQGLTNVSSTFNSKLGNPGKREVEVTGCARGGEIIGLWADAGCNDLFGNFQDSGIVKDADIAVCNETMKALYYDFEVLYLLLKALPEESARRQSILFSLFDAAGLLWDYTESEAAAAREVLKPELDKKGGDPSLSLSAIGHAHIDLAWLWPIRETIRKGARTFSTALKNLERYPGYVFGASQPQLYQWIKDYYPALYERVKDKIAEGRWEAQGAMWVEADANLSGGEALIRQILYGKRFFQKEFGKDVKVLWLPDVFGYSGALPQILKKSGVEYFLTIKLSWSQHNIHPHHTFVWKGIDNSEVLVHMPPEGEYNSAGSPESILKIERSFLDKGACPEAMLLFGIGDGGGGPGEEHLERLAREENLAGLPPVRQEPSSMFFERLGKNKARCQTFKGELYLEKHQGTYTTQARNKKYNRQMEFALRELEFIAVLAMAQGIPYPGEPLERLWKEVLLYQFHDILPGSSIKRVYDESLARYGRMYGEAAALTGELIGKVLGISDEKVVINSLSWERREWIRSGDTWFKAAVPAMGAARLSGETSASEIRDADDPSILENDSVRVVFADDGSIHSVFDKRSQWEALETGASSNALAVYYDDGDAWDMNETYAQRPPKRFNLVACRKLVDGPKQTIIQQYVFNRSTLEQEISVFDGSVRVDFHTSVDWRESGKMLRTAFYANVDADEVTCDIQFGNLKRPTHQNTSWDMAKFEICAHKYIDLSGRSYGVALLNDCKYGHCAAGNRMDINLLRSPSYPGESADLARHTFQYALFPHKGDFAEGEVVRESYRFNVPLTVAGGGKPFGSFVTVDNPNIIVETVKKAEDSDCIIIRLYECHGASETASVQFAGDVKAAKLTNMLEEEIGDIDLNHIYFGPYEIHTVKVEL